MALSATGLLSPAPRVAKPVRRDPLPLDQPLFHRLGPALRKTLVVGVVPLGVGVPLDLDLAGWMATDHGGKPAESLRRVGPHVGFVEVEEDVRRQVHLYLEIRLLGAERLHGLADFLDRRHDPAREAPDLDLHHGPDFESARAAHPATAASAAASVAGSQGPE